MLCALGNALVQIDQSTLVPGVSQSAQWAPFDDGYHWDSTAQNMVITNPDISELNSFIGGATQQATSVVTQTDPDCYELDRGCYSVYGFEVSPSLPASIARDSQIPRQVPTWI
jgi:beta-glucan synthesis-associated protein KRE6